MFRSFSPQNRAVLVALSAALFQVALVAGCLGLAACVQASQARQEVSPMSSQEVASQAAEEASPWGLIDRSQTQAETFKYSQELARLAAEEYAKAPELAPAGAWVISMYSRSSGTVLVHEHCTQIAQYTTVDIRNPLGYAFWTCESYVEEGQHPKTWELVGPSKAMLSIDGREFNACAQVDEGWNASGYGFRTFECE